MTTWIDNLTARSASRWHTLMSLVEAWSAPIRADDGLPPEPLADAEQRLEFALPLALREFHMLAGTRDDLFRQQNLLLGPGKLYADEHHLVVWHENQSVVRWGIPLARLEEDDPPVEMLGNADVTPAGPSFSVFVVQMLLLDLFAISDHGVFAWTPEEDDIETQFPLFVQRLPLVQWHWPAFPTRFYASEDVVLVVDGTGHICASARSEKRMTG